MKKIYIHPDHPCYGIDVWEVDEDELEIYSSKELITGQGYIDLEELVRFWKEHHK